MTSTKHSSFFKQESPSLRTRTALYAVLWTSAFSLSLAHAQEPTAPPEDTAADSAEDDVDIDVAATTSPPVTDPVEAPAPVAAEPAAQPAAIVETETSNVEEKSSPEQNESSSQPVLPEASAPGGGGLAPRSIEAEGSNYTRRLRRGLSWWGFIQGQYQNSQLSENQLSPDGVPLNEDQFALRRGRLRIDHGWENASATLELDASTVNGFRVGIRRAEASLIYRGTDDDQVTPLLVLTAGVTDIPFGAELGESQRDRIFMERSISSLALFRTEADLGVKLWGAYDFLNYAVAVVNGEPLDLSEFPRDPNAEKDIAAHVGVNALLLENLGVDGGLSVYTGTGFSPGRAATKDRVSWLDSNYNTIAEPGEIIGISGSAATPSQNFNRWALGLDLGFSLKTQLGLSRLTGEVVVASNLDRGVIPSDPILNNADIRQFGFTASFVQQITDYGLIGFRAAFYDANSDFFEQRAGVTHLRPQTFWVLSPVVGLTLSHGRIVAQYDIISDYLARDQRGVPTDALNNELTIRLQVDL